MRDVQDREDIEVFVNAFYKAIQEDSMLGPVFASRIEPDAWGAHLDKMYRFWDAILFSVPKYSGRPFPVHIGLGVGKEHFDRWIALFKETIQERFQGPKVEEAIARVELMGELFQAKLQHIESNPNRKPIL